LNASSAVPGAMAVQPVFSASAAAASGAPAGRTVSHTFIPVLAAAGAGCDGSAPHVPFDQQRGTRSATAQTFRSRRMRHLLARGSFARRPALAGPERKRLDLPLPAEAAARVLLYLIGRWVPPGAPATEFAASSLVSAPITSRPDTGYHSP